MPRADKLSPGGVKLLQPRDFQLPLIMSVRFANVVCETS